MTSILGMQAGALEDISAQGTTHARKESVANTHVPTYPNEKVVANQLDFPDDGAHEITNDHREVDGYIVPTAAELEGPNKLRRISAPIPWSVYTIAFVELCERFSYYGTTVVFSNFINKALPDGSVTGAGGADGQSGALGLGVQTSSGLSTFLQFWVYTTPLFGAYIADARWGRYKTICVGLAVVLVAHIILIISAIPPVIVNSNGALGAYIVAIIILGVGTGAFKPNISPLVVEQIPVKLISVTTLASGERVIVDPAITQSRIYHYFYLFINIGALIGQIGMVYAEKYVGFWLSFLLPTLLYLFCPAIMWWGRNRYQQAPPQGSVYRTFFRVWGLALKGCWSLNPVSTFNRLRSSTFWEKAKPSNIAIASRPSWMTYDDAFVDEVRRGLKACSVFCYFPLYWLTYNQLNNNLTTQAATMTLNGLPNDILNNLDPFALIILIPVCDILVYPALRKYNISFTPIKKITAGFMTGAIAMVVAAVIQQEIYETNPCGFNVNSLDCVDADGNPLVSNLNVWIQTPAYVLIALSEIFASITSLEYAYSKAPKSMRSMVQAIALFASAFAAAIGEAFNPLTADPLLTWNYGVSAMLSGVGGILFYLNFRHLDREEDALNLLPTGHVTGVEKTVSREEDDVEGQPAPREIRM